MNELLTEEEQIALLKKWLKQYGPTVIIGIVLALLINFSWQTWQNHRNRVLLHASSVYDEMLSARAQNNSNDTTVQAQKILQHYPRTPYADMAALILAREAVSKNDFATAHTQLQWVIEHSNNRSVREIARIRRARILLTEQKYDEALQSLDTVDDDTFAGLIDEVRGDIYLAKQDNVSARAAYKQAMSELPQAEVTRPILAMKYLNLT